MFAISCICSTRLATSLRNIAIAVFFADSPLAPLKSATGPLSELVKSMAVAKRITPAQLVRDKINTTTAVLLQHDCSEKLTLFPEN